VVLARELHDHLALLAAQLDVADVLAEAVEGQGDRGEIAFDGRLVGDDGFHLAHHAVGVFRGGADRRQGRWTPRRAPPAPR